MTKQKFVSIILFSAGLIFLAGFCIGRWAFKDTDGAVTDARFTTIRAGGYKFINPLLDYEQSENAFAELAPFKDKITHYINDAHTQGKAGVVSVYFRDLNNGPWYGVNETASFVPASLLKLPLMVAYYKQAETNPGILNQQIMVTASSVPGFAQMIEPEKALQVGRSYTVEQLLEYMIKYSENTAAVLLVEHIPQDALESVYKQFNIPIPELGKSSSAVTTRQYGSLLRVLFNGSYLTKDYSEKALEILSKAEFKDGLVAGVPGNVPVAHKFGEREDNTVNAELHDCGIIYYPNHPYVLCVMTQGKDINQLKDVIKGISLLVYTEVDSQMKE